VIPLPLLLPVPLYAETHYRFPFIWSILRKPEPEIIFDLPHRIEPGRPIPILLLVKDADSFPCEIRRIQARITLGNGTAECLDLLTVPQQFCERFRWLVFSISSQNYTGWVQVDIEFEINGIRRTKIYHNDNHVTSSHLPLRTFVASEGLPIFDDWHLGEGHSHSDRTDDQVEFGIPLAAAAELSEAMGLSYACVTDHSYDLDDDPDDYLRNHPEIPKWHLLQAEIDRLNANSKGFIFVRGEEVSCRTSRGRNVHLLLLGNRSFFPGSGDSAERWFRTWSEHSAHDILQARDNSTAALAAHPRESVPLLQRWLLGRGIWELEDVTNRALDGLQIANGKSDGGFADGLRMWQALLLKGQKIMIFAGDDAHGNFNRFRQIGIPFLKIRESHEQLFGMTRTAVRVKDFNEDSLVTAIRSGASVITDGPIVDIRSDGKSAIGETIPAGTVEVTVHSKTTSEYGRFQRIDLFLGEVGGLEKKLPLEHESENVLIARLASNRRGYLRAEAWTIAEDSQHGRSHFCLTNPVWLEP
jgi:hypothetical protein